MGSYFPVNMCLDPSDLKRFHSTFNSGLIKVRVLKAILFVIFRRATSEMVREHIVKYKSAFGYGITLAAALFLMKWLEWRFLIVNNLFGVYAGILAVVFTGLGIWLALKLSKPKTVILTVEKEAVPVESRFVLNESALTDMGISIRELEVLELIAEGLSNQEIAERLFVSLSTIKTHLSNVFEKLEVRRRTQAVEKARRLSLIP